MKRRLVVNFLVWLLLVCALASLNAATKPTNTTIREQAADAKMWQTYGKPLPDVLREFADRVPLLDARLFATAVLTVFSAAKNNSFLKRGRPLLEMRRFPLRFPELTS